ncbi:IS3 family transposase, partial [Mesorhizobium sp. A623]
NTVRPHGSLGNLPPAIYAKLNALGMQWDEALEQLGSTALPPIAPPSPKGSNDKRTLLSAG